MHRETRQSWSHIISTITKTKTKMCENQSKNGNPRQNTANMTEMRKQNQRDGNATQKEIYEAKPLSFANLKVNSIAYSRPYSLVDNIRRSKKKN